MLNGICTCDELIHRWLRRLQEEQEEIIHVGSKEGMKPMKRGSERQIGYSDSVCIVNASHIVVRLTANKRYSGRKLP
jgi:hypothetical protein